MGLLANHIECPECGGSDCASVYQNEDTHKCWLKCHSCGANQRAYDYEEGEVEQKVSNETDDQYEEWLAKWNERSAKPIPERTINSSSTKRFGVAVTPTHHIYPYFKEGSTVPCGFKIRRVKDKHLWSAGKVTKAMLFGEQRYGNYQRKRVVVTEGELDAVAASQMFKDQVAVVSVNGGVKTSGNDAKRRYKFLDGFEEIVICPDADEDGQRMLDDFAEVFAGKLRVMRLDPETGKDACDYLKAGQDKAFEKAYWEASLYSPDGVLSVDDMKELLSREEPDKVFEYPWKELNELTEGARPTELITVCAGSGLGKSSILREVVMHVRQTTTAKIGCLFMEESPKKTIEGFMSIDLSTPLHLERRAVDRQSEEYWQSFDRVFGDGNLFVMDASFDTGATVDQVVARVRFMAKALDCKVIVLDHISILVSAGQHGDERKALDEIMTKLRSLTQDTGFVLLAVSHLKRPDGKGHEEGAATSVSQLRGSASIAQLSDAVIGLERNGQAEDAEERNKTRVRVLKNRHSGLTGPAGVLFYDTTTGRLSRCDEADEEVL